jgi:type IV secretion system protein VirB2
MNYTPSLMDAPSSSPFAQAADWVIGTLFGSVAISLCVLAVAFVGLCLLSGRLAVRDGFRTLLGCFVLLGAPAVAAGLHGAVSTATNDGRPEMAVPNYPEAEPLPPANYDPYARVSMPTEREF